VDISHPGFEEQITIVNQTLQDINASNKPTLVVFNKIDAFQHEMRDEDDLSPKTRSNLTLEELKNSWMAKSHSPCIFISATKKENIDEFRAMLYSKVKEIHITRYPYDDFLF
jgi:GTP-binding protein HflX